MDEHTLESADLSTFSMERLQKELAGVQMGLEMLYTKNNSLDDLDLEDGGGSEEDQAEFQKLNRSAHSLVAEINKRHALEEIGE